MANVADRLRALALLELRRAARKAVGKGGRLRRPPRLLFPGAAERSYAKSLRNIVGGMRQIVESRIIPELPRLLAEAQAHRPTADNADVVLDRYEDAVAKLLELVRSEIFGEYPDDEIAALVERMGTAVAAQNGEQVGRVFKDVLGVDIFQAEPWLASEMSALVSQNVSLIKSLADRYLDRVEQVVYTGATSGLRVEDVARSLRSSFGATRRQAELIARDQVGKFNGNLAKLRQTQVGVTRYTWRTSHDDRVRDRHRELDGTVQEWSDPPVVDKRSGRRGHPGSDYQCRCYAEPVLDDVIDGFETGGDDDEA